MINFSIFKKDNKNSFFHRQQVSERGLLERIDKILNEISEEGLKEIFEVEERLKHIVNDPRTRIAMSKFSKEAKSAVKPIDVTPKKTKETPKQEGVEETVEEPVEVPVEETVEETPVEEPAEVPTEETVEVDVEDPVEVHVEETIEEASQETTEIPAEEPKEETKE